jgi:hypothetical protein
MMESKVRAAAFAVRLSELLTTDDTDPDVEIGRSIRTTLDDNGLMQCEHSGAEAILFVRGPDAASKAQALRILLARLEP